jgi:hypothetical protein
MYEYHESQNFTSFKNSLMIRNKLLPESTLLLLLLLLLL